MADNGVELRCQAQRCGSGAGAGFRIIDGNAQLESLRGQALQCLLQVRQTDGAAIRFLHCCLVIGDDARCPFDRAQARMRQIDQIFDSASRDHRATDKLLRDSVIAALLNQQPCRPGIGCRAIGQR